MNITTENAGRPTGERRSQSPLAPPPAVKRSQTNPPLSQHQITQNNLHRNVPLAGASESRSSLTVAGQAFRTSLGSQPTDSGGGGQIASLGRTLTLPDRRKKMHTYTRGDYKQSPPTMMTAQAPLLEKKLRPVNPREGNVLPLYTSALAKQGLPATVRGNRANNGPPALALSTNNAQALTQARAENPIVHTNNPWRDTTTAPVQTAPSANSINQLASHRPSQVQNPPTSINYFNRRVNQAAPQQMTTIFADPLDVPHHVPTASPLSSYQAAGNSNVPWALNTGAGSIYQSRVYSGLSLPQPTKNLVPGGGVPTLSADGTTRSFDSAPCGVTGAFGRRAPYVLNAAQASVVRTTSGQFGTMPNLVNLRQQQQQQQAPMSSRPSMTTRELAPPHEQQPTINHQQHSGFQTHFAAHQGVYEPMVQPQPTAAYSWGSNTAAVIRPPSTLTGSLPPPTSSEHRYILQPANLQQQSSFDRSAAEFGHHSRIQPPAQMPSLQVNLLSAAAAPAAAQQNASSAMQRDQLIPARFHQQNKPPSNYQLSSAPTVRNIMPPLRYIEESGQSGFATPLMTTTQVVTTNRPAVTTKWERYNVNTEQSGLTSGEGASGGFAGLEDDDCLSSEHRIINQVVRDQGITVRW